MEAFLGNLATIIASIAGALAVLVLIGCVIANLFFKQDFRTAISKMGAILLGLIIIGGVSGIVAAFQALGQQIG